MLTMLTMVTTSGEGEIAAVARGRGDVARVRAAVNKVGPPELF